MMAQILKTYGLVNLIETKVDLLVLGLITTS